jgi:hypothetical protein
LFGPDNVLVTDQYDSQSRFNSDYADALVVCLEEKDEVDKRNPTASLKSRATTTKIRKEHKGVDPVYQASFTEFIMTSNKDVPVKFEGREDQRRFMIMGADENFTRKTSPLADEVFTKLYGQDADHVIRGTPFVEDKELIAQFKHELYTSEELQDIKLRNFPKTEAYHRCFSLPRTTETTEIEAITRSIMPFIVASLHAGKLVTQVTDNINNTSMHLAQYVHEPAALQYIPAFRDIPAHMAVCRPLVFYDTYSGKPFPHALVERGLLECKAFMGIEYGVVLLASAEPLLGGFAGINNRHKSSPAARFALADPVEPTEKTRRKAVPVTFTADKIYTPNRNGERLRVNGKWQPDPNGEYETLNEMIPGTTTLANKTANVSHIDNFLFECDETTKAIMSVEESRIRHAKNNDIKQLSADVLFAERLKIQRLEADRLFKEGIAWRIVYSGGKSYHILVRVINVPAGPDEYKWLHGYLCTVLSSKLRFDPSTSDPARLTRAPVTRDREFDYNGVSVKGTQMLICEDPAIEYGIDWRPLYKQWLKRPLKPYEAIKGKRLYPTNQEYKDAMEALLNGTFWTNTQWNGRRQQCFFPAYRLCRMLGFSHDELWGSNGVMDGIENYYRPKEIGYWTSRENCGLIAEIDRDIEEVEQHDG